MHFYLLLLVSWVVKYEVNSNHLGKNGAIA